MDVREDLKLVIDEIAQAAKDALDNPRNVSKGVWENESMIYFILRIHQEVNEFKEVTEGDKVDLPHLVAEAGDVINFMAMAVQRYSAQADDSDNDTRSPA